MNETSSDTKITAIQTSQQKNGEFSLPEGKGSGSITVDSRVFEDASKLGGDPLKTSQQKAGEYSLSES